LAQFSLLKFLLSPDGGECSSGLLLQVRLQGAAVWPLLRSCADLASMLARLGALRSLSLRSNWLPRHQAVALPA
jgi:hypothetical protein